jgi:hypothetical protein
MSKAPFESNYPLSSHISKLTSELVEEDGWAKWGATMQRFEHDGPGVHGAQALIKHANSNFPFSSATAIMDSSCSHFFSTDLTLSQEEREDLFLSIRFS